MDKKGWKILAIVFIILFCGLFLWHKFTMYMADDLYYEDLKCQKSCLYSDDGYAYTYDYVEDLCLCYNDKKEIVDGFEIMGVV